MSLDFDSAALQMQHEDEEYDQEDYAREQELQQLLTDLPHDMLEDSGDHLSDFSASDDHDQVHDRWDKDAARWNNHPVVANPESDYEQDQNLYGERFLYDQSNIQDERHANDWPVHPNEDKDMYEISGEASEDGSDDGYLGGDGFKPPNHFHQSNAYHISENFRPYTNGQQEDFKKQRNQMTNHANGNTDHLKFGTSETTNGQSVEPYKVIYKPFQNNIQQTVTVSPDATSKNEPLEEMQQEFLGKGENSSDNMQILQLQVLNNAKGRKLEELNDQLEEKAQQIRYLTHQLAMMKDEKDGMCLSLQESQKLHQNVKEREVQLEGQIKALETQIQTLTANEEQLIKKSRIAEVAMESMQQQLLELRHSDTLQRAREQHEAIIATLKQKYEEQLLSLQQKLDANHVALQEQTELCCHLREHVKQLERTLEESKLEKTQMINQLSRSLEESQNQCANLLQTGLVKETNQLRLQLQQVQSAQLISTEMNKALQEEIKELKEEIALYECAAKHGIFAKDPSAELNIDMTDSYADLGIKKTGKKTRLQSAALTKETELSKDEIILELKAELERLLNSNKTKRNRISQLQNDLEGCQRTIEELKQQLEKIYVHESRGRNVESPSDILTSSASGEILRLKKENQVLQQEIESHNAQIQEFMENQEKLKNGNQELCSQMRQIIQDSDRDKQEALDRCERTYQQHFEAVKKKLCEEFEERHAAEKEKIVHTYENQIKQLKADIDKLNREIIEVKECYIVVCKEKDDQEASLKAAFEQEQQLKESKLKKQLLATKEEALDKLRTELEETYKNSLTVAKSQWLKEKEADLKRSVEKEVAVVKAFWEKEQKEITDHAVQEAEKKWQNRLDEAIAKTKKMVAEVKDHGSQTKPLSITDELLQGMIIGAVERQTSAFQEALKEKEKVLKEYESQHHESIASQVELALTKARARWLQELTELEEYKAHLKVAKEKWEKEHEISSAKQVSLTLLAAEEKWKKEAENNEIARLRVKELEDKVCSLKRELELKNEETSAIIKAELAKARTQWNKEKQEEILRIQDQNEKDYHSFLLDHKNKINEVLAKTKEDFAKQKMELLDQKEAELKLCLSRRQQEWAVQETQRFQHEIHQYEDRILVQVELLLDEMHKDLVRCLSSEPAWQSKWLSADPTQLNLQFKDKLKLCLRKAYRSTIDAILDSVKREWREKHEDFGYNFKHPGDPCLQNSEGETGDKARPFMYDVGQQVELQRMLRKQPPLQETKTEVGAKHEKRSPLSCEGVCCEHCHQQLEKKEKECQDLKKKLDKACWHLQLSMKEQKIKSEQVQGNGKTVERSLEENSTLKNKLDSLKSASVPPRSSSEGCVLTPCAFCDGKALEEMRSHYIKAVSKIKSDMLRYIHESKERAAEIIKTEVLRERQETARKMRKYYLICLQQLLIDDGKHDGAEKKIICAASKLATMAKILETPVRKPSQTKPSLSGLSKNPAVLSEGKDPKSNNVQRFRLTPIGNQSDGKGPVKNSSNAASHQRVPCCLEQQFDADNHWTPASQVQVGGAAFKRPGDFSVGAASMVTFTKVGGTDKSEFSAAGVATFQSLPSCVSQSKLQNVHVAGCAEDGSDSREGCIAFKREDPVKKEFAYRPQKENMEKVEDNDIQETPVRDEGISTDWSLVSGTLHMDNHDLSSCSAQKVPSGVPLKSMAHLFSYTKEDNSEFYQQPGGHKGLTLITERQGMSGDEGLLAGNIDHMSSLDKNKLGSIDAQLNEAALCPLSGKNHSSLQLRRPMHNVQSFQQDSGFDSPQINFE